MAEFTHYHVKTDELVPIYTPKPPSNDKRPFIEKFQENVSIDVISLTDDTIVFDLIGADVSCANALRRILLAEVPTMAIEYVYLQDNTSIMQDEVLAHRIGLIPIAVDPREFEAFGEDDEATDLNTIVFKLDVTCPEVPGDKNHQITVYSGDLEWQPQGDQLDKFPNGIAPVHKDIPIVILRTGQSLTLEAHCRKGKGKDHTKFSPCATASYRLLPEIRFQQPITGELAKELVSKCPMRVFDIEDIGKGKQAVSTATVARPRDCTMCRECIRGDGWDERVKLTRVAQHFIFTVESTGCLPPHILVVEAIRELQKKAEAFLSLPELAST